MLNLLALNSSQVVKLKDMFPHGPGFVLVFEYMVSNLSDVIQNAEHHLSEAQVKGAMAMLLSGLAFCHKNCIMHRVCAAFHTTLV